MTYSYDGKTLTKVADKYTTDVNNGTSKPWKILSVDGTSRMILRETIIFLMFINHTEQRMMCAI